MIDWLPNRERPGCSMIEREIKEQQQPQPSLLEQPSVQAKMRKFHSQFRMYQHVLPVLNDFLASDFIQILLNVSPASTHQSSDNNMNSGPVPSQLQTTAAVFIVTICLYSHVLLLHDTSKYIP